MNNDLISRSALLAEYCNGCDALAKKMCDQDICGVAMMINDAPAVDAVEVVRCEKCKHWEDGWLGYCTKCHTAMPYDGFCSYGERREDG